MILKFQERYVYLLVFLFACFDFILRVWLPDEWKYCNRGIAWGMSLPRVWIITSSILLLGGVLWLMVGARRIDFRVAWGLLFTGGFINLVDRLWKGCVEDYIHLPLFPSFNLADMMLFLGVIGILFSLTTGRKDLNERVCQPKSIQEPPSDSKEYL